MALATSQMQTLKTFILADPTLGPKSSGDGTDYGFIADALNADFSPSFWCWRSILGKHDVTDLTSIDPLDGVTTRTFNWSGSGGFIQRSQGERDAWIQIWNTSLTCNPSLANVRSCFNDIFSGAGAGATNNRAHIVALSKRKARLLEKILATGTGTAASPGLFTFEGAISVGQIGTILAS